LPWAILDTSVYIGHWEAGLFEQALAQVRRRFIIRQSSVVLSELRRGARTKAAAKRVEELRRLAPSWAPLAADWWEAGRLIRAVGDAQDWETSKRRDFQNDALVGLTAHRHGATVVTANHHDFHLLARRIAFDLIAV
jgi:predicted nucleic acid-binding protein